ncbi:MAG: CNNM domain-containing protein, partial [Anaerovoracaceae bacterium]|nr:CNNM domain-containing protein [Anaerovoracaceae bacterium]
MDSHTVLTVAVMILLVALSAYFSATETAYTSMNRIKLKNAAADGDGRAKKVLKLSDQYDKLLTTILIGNNIANITLTAISTALFIGIFGSRLGPTYSTIVVTLVVLVFAEISPKALAKEEPEKFAKFAEPAAHGIMIVLTPLNAIFSGWKKLLVKIFNIGGERTITED